MDHMADWQWGFVLGHGIYGIVFWVVIAFIVFTLIREITSHK